MEWALFATGCVIIALVAHSIIVTGKVHRRLIDRLTDITRIEYESEADRNNVSVKYYVTVRNQLAVVLTIAATDSPITMPDHDAALSTVFINNVSQRAASYKVTCSRHLNDWRRSEVGASRSRHLMVPVSAGYPRAPHGSSDCVPTVAGGGVGPRRGCSWRRSRPGRAMRRTPGTPTRARPNPWCPRIGSRSRSTVGWTDTIC